MIVVTGGCGFVGKNLIVALYDKGYRDILCVDVREKIEIYEDRVKNYTIGFMDHRDFLFNISRLVKIEIIFHQGACTNTMNYDDDYMMKTNFEYSKALFDHCRKNNIRLVYASSAAVYGLGDHGFQETIFCENPINIYAKSKLLFDNYVRCFSDTSNQVVGLRYFNVYGPGEENKGHMSSVVCQFLNQIRDSESVRPFKNSDKYLRDFICVDDIVNINLHFLEKSNVSGIYNCGTGNARSFMDIVFSLQQFYKFDIIEKDMNPELKGKYQTFTEAHLSALKESGYKLPFTSLESGIQKYVEYFDENNKL